MCTINTGIFQEKDVGDKCVEDVKDVLNLLEKVFSVFKSQIFVDYLKF